MKGAYINMQQENIIKNTNKDTRTAGATSQKKYIDKFLGSYIYYIFNKHTQNIVYIGQTTNIVARVNEHYHSLSSVSSSFHDWIIEQNKDKQDYEVEVLDLTAYEQLDFDDRLLIEKVLQYHHSETIINKRIPKKLNAYEIERMEQIHTIIDFNFIGYRELKAEKMQNKKSLTNM